MNILTNALHAVGEGGKIQVSTGLATVARSKHAFDNAVGGTEVAMIYVDDSGPGIPEADLSKIFDPFFTTKPTGIGTGLGLSISRKIIEMHGGTIDIGNRGWWRREGRDHTRDGCRRGRT